jgi:DNA repair exonuclease SbcCD ATPase subunit
MYIKDIEISGFKNIKDINVSFDKINHINGPNGTGKSSFMEALVLVICNYTGVKLSECINWDRKFFEIKTNFSHLNNDYNYRIKCSKNSTERELVVNYDKDNVIYNSDVVAYLEKNIVDPILALYSSVSIQDQGTQLLFDNPAPRLATLKKILKSVRAEKVAENIKRDEDKIKEDKKSLVSKLELLESKEFVLKEEPVLPDTDVTTLKKDLVKIDKDIIEYEKKKHDYEQNKEQLEKYNEAQKQIPELEVRLSTLNNEINTLKNQLKAQPEFDESIFTSLKDEKSLLEKDVKFLSDKKGEVSLLVSKIDTLQGDISILEKERDEIVLSRIPVLDFDEKDIQKLEKDSVDISSDLKVKNSELELAKSGKCPTCKKDYEVNPAEIEDKIKELKVSQEQIQKVITDKKDRLTKHKDLQNQNSLKLKSKEEKQTSIDSKSEDLEKLIKDRDSISFDENIYIEKADKLKKIETQFEKVSTERDKYFIIIQENSAINDLIAGKNNVITRVNSTLENYQKINKPISVDFVEDDSLYANKKTISESIETYNTKLTELEAVKAYNSSIEDDQKKTKKDINKLKKDVESKNKDIHDLNTTRSLFKNDFSSYLITKGITTIKKQTNDFFNKTYGKYNIDFENDEKGVSFYFKRSLEDINKNVKLLSGYEKSVYANAFKVSLSKLQKNSLGLYIGDEIDPAASDDNSIKLIGNILNQGLEQYFFITHKEATKEYLHHLEGSKVIDIEDGKLNDQN